MRRKKRLLWVGLALLLVGFFLKLSWELHEDTDLESIDRNVLIFISNFRSPRLNSIFVDLSALGSPTVLAIISVLTTVLLWRRKDRIGSTYIAIGSTGAAIATTVMKHLFTRARPTIIPHLVEVEGYSYPSGHSLGATSIYLFLLCISWRHYRSLQDRVILSVFTGTLISAIATSRLYLGVHYPSDILSGILLGAAWVCFLTYYFSSYIIRQR